MKYPNPKFFRMKDHMNLKLQAENLKEVGGIIKDMLKETDWKDPPSSSILHSAVITQGSGVASTLARARLPMGNRDPRPG